MYDVIIIGGGPAGLSAGLVLGRSRRSVLICDSGTPRNAPAAEMHGYLTRDGINPLNFLKIAREEIIKYRVQIESREITDITPLGDVFEVSDSSGEKFRGKKILIATGVKDNIPDIEGIYDMYGKSVFHCPYCDGWEVQEKRLAVIASGRAGYMLSFSLKTWSSDVILLTNGLSRISKTDKEKLAEGDIKFYTQKIKKLEGAHGKLEKIIFNDSSSIERDAIFFSYGHKQQSPLAEKLGCNLNKMYIKTDMKQKTSVSGVFVAGDAAKDIKFVIVAAAEGARAGVAINIALQEDERRQVTAAVTENGK